LKGEVIPSWDVVLEEEEVHDGNVLFDWAFLQGNRLEQDWRIDQESKEIWYNVINKENHSYNVAKS